MAVEPGTPKTADRLGDTGQTVRANIKRLREARRLTQSELATMMTNNGRTIPVLGIQRMESGSRRVDVDDLVALSVALQVSPITLLMPDVDSVSTRVSGTGVVKPGVYADMFWEWLRGEWQPFLSSLPPEFISCAWPRFRQTNAPAIDAMRAKSEWALRLQDERAAADGND